MPLTLYRNIDFSIKLHLVYFLNLKSWNNNRSLCAMCIRNFNQKSHRCASLNKLIINKNWTILLPDLTYIHKRDEKKRRKTHRMQIWLENPIFCIKYSIMRFFFLSFFLLPIYILLNSFSRIEGELYLNLMLYVLFAFLYKANKRKKNI